MSAHSEMTQTDTLVEREKGDWYCKNCGYLPWNRVTYYETCDECHIPVEWHSVNEMTELETMRERVRELEGALETANKAFEMLKERRDDCGDPDCECALQDMGKNYHPVTVAINAIKALAGSGAGK